MGHEKYTFVTDARIAAEASGHNRCAVHKDRGNRPHKQKRAPKRDQLTAAATEHAESETGHQSSTSFH